MSKRVVWAVIAIAVLLLAIAPLFSYCFDRKQDYRDKGEMSAPRPAQHAAAVVTSPLIR
jgi:hypothetical protein